MARKLPSHLKLHTEDAYTNGGPQSAPQAVFDLSELMDSFAETTGWIPRPLGGTPHHPSNQLDDEAPPKPLRQRVELVSNAPIDGMLDVDDFDGLSVTSEDTAWRLLEQIDSLVQGLNAAEKTIHRQEAQLATSLGVSIRHDESEILATRLNESLHRAAMQTGSDAAALYLLDENTSQLKMRSCWGLPTAALSKEPRDLRGSMADLEALLGNAVLLENTALAQEWACPEDFTAGMCVPIGSPTMPHGTIWLWSDHVRDFSSQDIDAAKAAADKILVDIERSVLADEVLRNRGLDRQLNQAGLTQASRLPDSQPLHSDYEIAAWTFQGQALGGNFHTWGYNSFDQICAGIGAAATHGASGALVASAVQAVVDTCMHSRHKPQQVLRRTNDVLWGSEEGDWRSSLAYLQVHPESGALKLAMAGSIQAFVVSQYGHRMLAGTPTMLAELPDTSFTDQQLHLEAGELLVLVSSDVVAGMKRGGVTQQVLLETIAQLSDDPVQEIVDHLGRMVPLLDAGVQHDIDRSLMILRRSF